MLEAFLYNRQTRDLTTLDEAGVLACVPPETSEANGKTESKDNGKVRGAAKGAFRGTLPSCREGEMLWLDFTAPTDEDYRLISQRFGLHPMVVEDLKTREGRPKLHDYGAYLYVIFYALTYEERNDGEEEEEGDELLDHAGSAGKRYVLHLHEIDCLVGGDFVVTMHKDELQPLQDLQRRIQGNSDLMRGGTGYLLYEIMDEVLDDYFPLLDQLDERIDELENRLFESGRANMTSDIFVLKRCLVQVRRIAGPMRDVVNVLLRRDADSGGKNFAYFQDLYDHATRIVDMIDAFRDILSGALDAHLAVASNNLNEIMKKMTAASIMLLVPNLIAAIYGMNFENMPELHLRYGYFAALLVMISSVVALFFLFRRKGWL